MARVHYSWATITGKVYVEEFELQDQLREMFPELVKEGDDDSYDSVLENCTAEQERKAFEACAMENIGTLFPTDTPFKEKGIDIDLNTYQALH